MTRARDEDEIGYGASVAYLSDAARRRAERGDPSPDDAAPTPDPDAGIELITSLDAGQDDVEESADDALERALARRHGAPDTAPGVLPVPDARERESRVDPAGPREGEPRGVREALEHHHERRDPRAPATITPRGSADFPPHAQPSSAPSRAQSSNTASRPRHLVAGSLAAVALLVVIAIGVEAGSSTATHHRAPAAATRVSTQNVARSTSLIALELKRTSVAIGAEAEIAASAHAATEAKAKTRVEARARAQAAQRARAAAARRQRAAAQRAHALSTAGSAAVVSTQTSATDQVSTTPASSADASSTGSSSSTPSGTGASGGSSASAGPTAIGSTGSNCNPKCS